MAEETLRHRLQTVIEDHWATWSSKAGPPDEIRADLADRLLTALYPHGHEDPARSTLNALLVTRQAHEEASAAEARLAFDMEADGAELLAAHDRTAVAESAYEAAWQRARDVLAVKTA